MINCQFGFADTAIEHQERCNSQEIKELVGKEGSCKVLIAPKKRDLTGECNGIFNNLFPCKSNLTTDKTGSHLHLVCGTDTANPIVDLDMEAEITQYNLATIIQKRNGQDEIRNDSTEYLIVSTQLVDIRKTDKDTQYFLKMQNRSIPLTDVKCSF